MLYIFKAKMAKLYFAQCQKIIILIGVARPIKEN